MKKLFLAFISSLCLISALAAEDAPKPPPASSESVERLLILTQMDLASENMTEYMKGVLDQQMAHTIETEELGDAYVGGLESTRNMLSEWIESEMAWEKIKAIYVASYASVFTQEEIDDLIAFYETPTGRSFIEKQPQLQPIINYYTQDYMGAFMKRFQSRYNALISDLLSSKTQE